MPRDSTEPAKEPAGSGPRGAEPPRRGPGRDPRLEAVTPGRGATLWTGFALVFLVVSLLALILVPTFLEGGLARIRDEIQTVLEPAQRLAAEIELAQARQMAAYQAFLLSGDARFRVRYRDARGDEERAAEGLRPLTEGMSVHVQEEVFNLLFLSLNWHLGHQEMLGREVLPADTVSPSPRTLPSMDGPELEAELAAYEEILSASRALRETLDQEMRRGEAAMTRARDLRSRITGGLVLVGLLAAVVVIVLAWHLRTLMTESEARRREALKARREADALLEATGDGVLGMDREGRCTFLNRAGAELLGYPKRLVTGRDVHDLLHHSHPDGTAYERDSCPIVQALADGRSIQGRNEVLWRAGRESFPVRVSLRPMKDGLDMKGAVLTFTDMTETRAAEETLRQAVRSRDEVLAVVSHDLRNPVGTIFSAASLLLDLDVAPERRREHLTAVKRSAERMNRLIQDLLDVAKMEGGGLRITPSVFDVEDLVEDVLRTRRMAARDGGVELVFRECAGPLRGWGDRDRLVQVLGNLLDNAIRVTPSGGTVSVGAAEWDHSADESPAEAASEAPEAAGAAEGDAPAEPGRADRSGPPVVGLRFAVSDTGPGISPLHRERLFDRFWQVRRRDKQGAGLGLSIVKGLVEAHGGTVGVTSREGKGSSFWFTLPAKLEEGGADAD